MRKQLSYILGRQQRYLELGDDIAEAEDLQEIMSNSHLNTNFLALARELDIMEPKKPEDIYKSHLEKASHTVDSARANLASSYVNAFVNAGFGTDKLLSSDESGGTNTNWIYKNKVKIKA
jgi:26S proteasome regulatory subunit N1